MRTPVGTVSTVVNAITVLTRKARSAEKLAAAYLHSQRFGRAPSAIYTEEFFLGVGCADGARSAPLIAQLLCDTYRPSSVFDLGCGRGALLSEFQSLGVEAFGCDGSVAGVRMCPPDLLVFHADLRRPLHLNKQFDLVLCIEVAEHLPARYAPRLVESMASLASERIAFCAAGPGEPGDDHINLKSVTYWEQLFARHGFVRNDSGSKAMVQQAIAADIAPWFRRLQIFERSAHEGGVRSVEQ
jgi:SAM-dependent methyltransferase